MPRSETKRTNVRLLAASSLLRAASALSPNLAARILERLFLATRRFDVPDRERQWIENTTRSSFTSGHHELPAWSLGDGPMVLLAHGWEGRGSQMGAFIAPLTEAGFRVVTFDAPGHGQSRGRQSSLIEIADAVSAAADAFGPVHAVVAHSAGAAATTVALSKRLSIGRAVFIAPPADLGGFLHTITRRVGLPNDVAERTRRRIEARFQVDWDSLRAATLAPTMTTPLLVVHDEGDREVRFDNATTLANAWPGAELYATQGLGHRRVLRDSDVAASVVSFIKGGVNGDAERAGDYASRAAASPAAL